jgi:nucleoredoxin
MEKLTALLPREKPKQVKMEKLTALLPREKPKQVKMEKGTEVSKEALVGKTIGLYFSAHWCPPCRSFTPTLVKFRDANKKEFEVVFVSSDRSPKDQMAYMKETGMKWYTMPHRSSAANALAKKYGISGIPALVIVSPDGKTITKNGRSDVTNNAKGAIKSWAKKSS